jgi:prepilin-type N-terminal cleavage/methylation domain-containing protein
MRVTPAIDSRRGFTLIEILIATAAFAIVLSAISGVFYGALRLRNASAEAIERNLPLTRAVNSIRRDLANIVLPGGTMFGPLQTTSITNSLPGQVSPDFYTTSGVIDEVSYFGDVQRVAYALAPPADRAAPGLDLIRGVSRNLLPPNTPDVPTQQWLLGGVRSLTFTYYNGTQWVPTWDSTTTDPTLSISNNLPLAIKVQIFMAPERNAVGQPAPVEIIVPLMVQVNTNQTASTGASR